MHACAINSYGISLLQPTREDSRVYNCIRFSVQCFVSEKLSSVDGYGSPSFLGITSINNLYDIHRKE